MRSIKTMVAGLAVALLAGSGALAGSDLNEVGAVLVFPTVANANFGPLGNVETFVTITNAGPEPVVAHVSYINGNSLDPHYCYECDFELPLTGNDTETLVITNTQSGIAIESEDSPLSLSCPWFFGMIVVTLEHPVTGETITDNVLLGEEVVINYIDGSAFSIPAIPFQGKDGGNGDRSYDFDDTEYGKLPRIVAADFLAPSIDRSGIAALSLFTLNFDRQFPPLVDCSVTGFDAREFPFSASFQFGCWGLADLCSISPEFCWPNLGQFSGHPAAIDSHGWLQLNCRVDRDPTDGFQPVDGGVHGAILQVQIANSIMAAGSNTPILSSTSWGRLLYQSVTTGDAVNLTLEGPPAGLD